MTDLVMLILISLCVGGSVFALIWALFRHPAPIEAPVQRRVAAALGAVQRKTIFEQPMLSQIVAPFLRLASGIGLPGLRQFIRNDLEASGNPNGYSTDEFLALCLLSSVAAGAGVGVAWYVFAKSLGLFWITVAMLLGFGAPLYSVHEQALKRTMRISKQLPYTLDLVALTMAAGSSFSEAIDTMIRDNPNDDLNQELKIVQAEIEFGTKRATALTNLADRIPLETLRSVIGAVNQAEVLGTPLSTILKNQAGMLRMHRSVRAEKLSASASLRILIPSMLILFAVVMLIFGPMVLRMRESSFFG